jgi:hypothetical protein
MRFHGVFLGSQHEIWPKQHNGKVSREAGLSVPLRKVAHWCFYDPHMQVDVEVEEMPAAA